MTLDATDTDPDITGEVDLSHILGDPDEPLDPELAEYLEDSAGLTGWRMIRHPLVYAVPYDPTMAGLLNRQLRAKTEAMESALQSGQVHHAIWLHERAWRLDAFLRLSVGIDPTASSPAECPSLWELDEDQVEVAMNIWTDSENITSYRHWWEALWAPESPHRRTHPDGTREVLTDDEGARLFFGLPDEFTVFKGGDPSGESFLSWTLDYETAEFFARRVSGNEKPRKVISRRLKKSQVFAMLGDRGEQEVLALPQ